MQVQIWELAKIWMTIDRTWLGWGDRVQKIEKMEIDWLAKETPGHQNQTNWRSPDHEITVKTRTNTCHSPAEFHEMSTFMAYKFFSWNSPVEYYSHLNYSWSYIFLDHSFLSGQWYLTCYVKLLHLTIKFSSSQNPLKLDHIFLLPCKVPYHVSITLLISSLLLFYCILVLYLWQSNPCLFHHV